MIGVLKNMALSFRKNPVTSFAFITKSLWITLKEATGQLRGRIIAGFDPQQITSIHNINNFLSHKNYGEWIRYNDTLNDDDCERIKESIARLTYRPLISLVVPVYNTPEKFLRMMIDSVLGQLYENWELCLADDASKLPHVRRVIEEYRAKDRRIKVVYREQNGHISAASNSALSIAKGEFIALLDHDDVLPAHALYMIAEELNRHPDADLLYSDEDIISEGGQRYRPYFKPDWNLDLFLSHNCVSHFGVYRSSIIKKIGGFRAGYEGSQDYDLALRFILQTKPERIRHIPHILYHWRAIEGSAASSITSKMYAFTAARKAIKSYMEAQKIAARVTKENAVFLTRIIYPLPAKSPKVSIIINCVGANLEKCLHGIIEKTEYVNYEIILINGSVKHPYEQRGDFKYINSRNTDNTSLLLNTAVRIADGEYICFMNPDMEVLSGDWLDEMVSHAARPSVGCVGSKEYYPDGTVRQAGIILGINDTIVTMFHNGLAADNFFGYVGRARSVQSYSAVSGNCMVLRKSFFRNLKGFNHADLPSFYYDIDLCLRMKEKGLSNIWTPFAEFYFHGSDKYYGLADEAVIQKMDSPDMRASEKYMRGRWGSVLSADPGFNPNITVSHKNECVSFVKSHVEKPWIAKSDPVKDIDK